MRLPLEWIEELLPTGLPAAEVARILTMAGLEVEEIAESSLGAVLDIKVTPNRGDCLSVHGIVRELAAALSREWEPPARTQESAGSAGLDVSIEVLDTDLCPLYVGRRVTNVRQAPSPEWLQDRLTAAGMRPIGGIVDITNYVMLERGQPMHAFDAIKLAGPAIVVRRAEQGEVLNTLDGEERTLTPDVLVIADSQKAVAVAGVMGGADSEVTDTTREVLLESAHFAPLAVRRASRALGLRTEASYRFERHVDPSGAAAAADRACQLIEELGMGRVEAAVCACGPGVLAREPIVLRLERAHQMLGFAVSREECRAILGRLGFCVADGSGDLQVTPPSWRQDVVREIDLIEEIGRVAGYDRMPERLPSGETHQGADTALSVVAGKIRAALAGAGLNEALCHTLQAPSAYDNPGADASRVRVRSALSEDLSTLRASLLPGLIEVAERNFRRGVGPLALFEVGKVFGVAPDGYRETTSVGILVSGALTQASWADVVGPSADVYTAKALCQRVASACGLSAPAFAASSDPRLHPYRQASVSIDDEIVGVCGELHPSLAERLRIRSRVVLAEMSVDRLLYHGAVPMEPLALSSYQAVERDIAPRVATEVSYGEVVQALAQVSSPILEGYRLVEVFSGPQLGEGLKSFTLSLTLRSHDHTLTEPEVKETVAAVRQALSDGVDASFPA